MRLDADRSHPGATSAVRNGEGLVQIEVGDVGSEGARPGDADHGVEIRPVEIHLATVAVHDIAHLGDAFFEDPMSRRVRHHDRRQPSVMSGGFVAQVAEIDVAVVVGRNHHDAQPGHGGARRIGPMGGGGDQADVTIALPPTLVV